MLGRCEEALTFSNEAIKLDPKYALAWSNKGAALESLGKHEEALTAFNETIRLDPRDTNAWYNKAAVLSFLNRNDKAIQALEKAMELNLGNEKVRQLKQMIQSKIKASRNHTSDKTT